MSIIGNKKKHSADNIKAVKPKSKKKTVQNVASEPPKRRGRPKTKK